MSKQVAETTNDEEDVPFCVRCHEDFPVATEPAYWTMGELRPAAKAPKKVRDHWSVGYDPNDIRGKPMLCGNCYFDLTDGD